MGLLNQVLAFVTFFSRLDLRRFLESGFLPESSGEERGLLSRTAAGDQA